MNSMDLTMRLKSGVCLFVLFLSACYQAGCARDELDIKQVQKRAAPTTKVIVDTAELLKGYFVALYTLFPICIFECCICIPIGECSCYWFDQYPFIMEGYMPNTLILYFKYLCLGLGLVLGICATVPGCRIYKSLSRKVREEYILEQEAQMIPPNIVPSTTVYPGNMPAELPPYEQYAQD